MPYLIVYSPLFLLAIIALAFLILLWQRQRIRYLGKNLAEKTEIIEHTSKLLIEKNLEISDHNIRLQQLLEAKSDFISIASHQLRTPATEIKWGVIMLLESTFGDLNQEQKEHVAKLYAGSQRMIRLIDNLLGLVKLEEGYSRPLISSYNFDELVIEITKKIEEQFQDKNISVVFDLAYGNHSASIDLDSVTMVINNLIENAFHYTPPEGKITIKTKMTNAKALYFSIQDSGIGISPQKQETIFKKFQRGETAMQMNSGGIGLGLYIVKNIIEQHRGIIDFTTVPHQGTTFYFTIP